MTDFASLGLVPALLRAIEEAGYTTPTPIQSATIPALLEGRDVLGCAQTGTGKTAAFALPVLQMLERSFTPSKKRPIRALVLSPTRELTAQIAENVELYGKHLRLRSTVLFGGINPRRQVVELEMGVDVLIATPGRLLDLMGQGYIDLSQVRHFVLDEADRMLDMGFLPDIRRVMRALPANRQNLLFSATMPGPIAELASTFLKDPVKVSVTPPSTTVERIEQSVLFVEKGDKNRLLVHLLDRLDVEQAIVFTRTKHGANRLVQYLEREGISAAALHGNKSQNARERALDGFRDGTLRLLVATDIASRGIDVEGVSHVFNFDLPNESESYVHRIGRTGRAGRAGVAVAFCCDEEIGYLRDIEKTIRLRLPIVTDHPAHAQAIHAEWMRGGRGTPPPPPGGRGGGGGGRGRDGGRDGGFGGGRSGGGRPGGRDDGRGAPRRDEPRAAARSDERARPAARPDERARPAARPEDARTSGARTGGSGDVARESGGEGQRRRRRRGGRGAASGGASSGS